MTNQNLSMTTGTAGSFLLEAMLACGITALVLTGCALALQETLRASSAGRRDTQLRLALESRLAELQVEPVREGSLEFAYPDGLRVTQTILPAAIRNEEGAPLEHLFQVRLKASSGRPDTPPLETEALVFRP